MEVPRLFLGCLRSRSHQEGLQSLLAQEGRLVQGGLLHRPAHHDPTNRGDLGDLRPGRPEELVVSVGPTYAVRALWKATSVAGACYIRGFEIRKKRLVCYIQEGEGQADWG